MSATANLRYYMLFQWCQLTLEGSCIGGAKGGSEHNQNRRAYGCKNAGQAAQFWRKMFRFEIQIIGYFGRLKQFF